MVATAGTARHSMVLDFAVRPLLSFLHAVVLPTGVFVDTAEFGADSALPRRVATAAGELAEQLTSVVSGVAGFTGSTETREPAEGDATAGEGVDGAAPEDADFHVPAGGFAALLAGHSGE
ncbi:MAG: oxidoreductase, partial [Corynebacterium variabile]|nr:oxidoreductase [Corynebacterium variabile]